MQGRPEREWGGDVGWQGSLSPTSELLLAEAQFLAVACQSRLLSGTADSHKLILQGPSQLQEIHLLIHTEVKTLERERAQDI